MKVKRLLLAVLCLAHLAPGTIALAAEAESRVSGFDALGQTSFKVDQIEISGVTVFTSEEIQAVLEISPGDRLERFKVVRSAENLQGLYKLHGYEHVGIRSELHRRPGQGGQNEAVLEFVIIEGEPTRIAEIRFVPDSSLNSSLNRYWQRMEQALKATLGIAPGDNFDQTKIASAKRSLQDLMASEEFVGAKVDDVRIFETAAPADAETATAPAQGRWVRLEFRVDLGDRVTFGFRGNTVFGSSQLQTLVQEQRLLGFGKDYIGAIRLKIEELYRSAGYAQVAIRPYTFERLNRQEKHVTYFVSEGPKVKIHSIEFDGNTTFSSAELISRLQTKSSTLLKRGYYVQADIQKAAELTMDWMKSKGYLGSKLITVNSVPVSRDSVRVVIYVYEGDQTLVRDIRFSGATLFSDADLGKQLGISEGQPLNLFEFSERLELLKAAYRAQGYLSMRVEDENSDNVVRYAQDNRFANISLTLHEGPRYRISAIEVAGLQKTEEHVVLRQLKLKVGDVLGEREIFESEARLRRLGIFSSANIQLNDDPRDPERKIVHVSVREGTPGFWALGVGYRTDLGPRVFGQVGYANVGGNNHTASLSGVANRRLDDFRFVEVEAQLGYLWPSFVLEDATFRPTLTFNTTRFPEFDAATTALAMSWEKTLFTPDLTGVFTWNVERVRQFNAPIIDGMENIDNIDVQLASIATTLRLDLRNDPLNPVSGFFAQGSADLTAPWLGSQAEPYPVGFLRMQLRTDYHLKLPFGASWLFSFRSGFERNNEAEIPGNARSGMIPSIKTFALGGPTSLRGFKEQQMNLYETAVKGSAAYANYRTQLDLPFSGSLRFGPFLDAASLFTDPFASEEIRNSPHRVPFRWRYGAGVGVRYQTPVGSVNLDWALNLKPEPMKPKPGEEPKMEDRWIWHFSIGVL